MLDPRPMVRLQRYRLKEINFSTSHVKLQEAFVLLEETPFGFSTPNKKIVWKDIPTAPFGDPDE